MEINTTKTISTSYGAFTIDCARDKKMMETLESRLYPNEDLLSVARAFVNKKSIVVDIGAHIGTFAIPIASEVEEVIAFEPSSETFSLLSHNAKENSASLKLINKALGSKKGSGTILARNASNSGANTIVTGGDIPVAILDSEVTHADFIKIDVEGMELEVLRGGSELIKHSRPVVLFEVNLSQLRAHNASPRTIEKFFILNGYRLYFPIEEKDFVLARVQSATLLTALIAPRSWLLFSDSAPFDLLAVPKERLVPFPTVSFMSAIRYAICNNITSKYKRIIAKILAYN